MSLLPEDACFLELVQAYFLTFRGDGVALSPLDAELLCQWDARRIPYQVVFRGIRKTAESLARDARPGARVRTLRSCRAAVEREFKRYQGLSAGGHRSDAPAPPPEDYAQQRLAKARTLLRRALAHGPTAPQRRGLEAALTLLAGECVDPRELSGRVARADDAMALAFLRELPFAERCGLVREARALAGPRQEGASPFARKEALRAHLVALARERGQLIAIA